MNGAVKSPQVGVCERVVVTAADGRTYDLGSPASPLFRARVWAYRLRRKLNRG